MDNRLAMLSRGFLGGNPAGPIMDIVGGAISKGGDALSAVEKYAQMVAQQKAQEAATTPEAQFDMEAMRKQLGEAPDVFTAPEGMKYVAGTDSSNVPIAGLGIALDIFMKNRAEKSAKLREDYNKKLAKYDAVESKKIMDSYERSTPEYQEKQKLSAEDRDWTQKTRARQEQDWAYQDKIRSMREQAPSMGGGSGSGGSSIPSGVPGIDPKEQKWYYTEIDQMGSRVNYDPTELQAVISNRVQVDPRFSKIHQMMGGAKQPGPSEEELRIGAIERAKTRKAQAEAMANQQAQPTGTTGVDVMREIGYPQQEQPPAPSFWEILMQRNKPNRSVL